MRTIVTVCRSVTLLNPAKMAELIEMPFGLRTQVGSRNHVLHGGQHPPWEGAILRAEWRPIVRYTDTLQSSVQ